MSFTKHIDVTSRHQIVMGPRGIRLTLDAAQIYPEEPGMGTPRLVQFGRETMTLDCAFDNVGEIIPDAESFEDAKWAYDWLESHREKADEWLDRHWRAAEAAQKTEKPA